MKCPNCKTAAYMTRPYPQSGRCGGCDWMYGGTPSEVFDANGAMRHQWNVAGVPLSVTADPTVPPHMAYVMGVDLATEPARTETQVFAHCGKCGTTRLASVEMRGWLTCPGCDLIPPADPLDAVIDGVPLHRLLMYSEMYRREEVPASPRHDFTPAQRAALSAYWSAELRARVEATANPRLTVMVDCEED